MATISAKIYRLVGTAVGSHEAVVALGLVILVELVELYNLYQLVGILRVGAGVYYYVLL